MSTLEIHQTSLGHPGRLTDEDIADLAASPVLEHVRVTQGMQPPAMERHDAGVLVIVLVFVVDKVTGGALEEAGKRLNELISRKVTAIMRRKRDATGFSTYAYRFKQPNWELRVKAKDDQLNGFEATITASTPEAMEAAAERLNDVLSDARNWRLAESIHDLSIRETRSGLEVRHAVHGADRKETGRDDRSA
jgi:hypothetical protein